MTRTARRTAIAALTVLAAVATILAADFAPPAAVQSEEETTGRIVARLLEDGRVEFGWQPTGGAFGEELVPDRQPGQPLSRYARVLPTQRYFPASVDHNRWLRSSPVEFKGFGDAVTIAIGRIEARQLEDGRIEFAFTPTDGERILTDARYFPTSARPNRWLRSTEITIGAPSPFIAVSAGFNETCGLRESGELECWIFTSGEQIDAPEGSFTAVSVGSGHNCAIRASDGAIECWGTNRHALTNAPEGSFIAVSVGSEYTCAIAETFTGTNAAADTGEIECWGDRGRGRGGSELYKERYRDDRAGRYRAISATVNGTCAIRDTGELACWGRVSQVGGEARDNQNNPLTFPGPPEGRFTAVSATQTYTCGLRESGEIACWGDVGIRNVPGYERPVSPMHYAAPEGKFTAISSGGGELHDGGACAIRESDGGITCWGVQGERANTPTGGFTAVSAGVEHACGLRSDGEIECWQTSRRTQP